ncbi:MAG: 3-dehydroquinate synthase [Solirubrobacterales bacterium]
MSEFTVSSSLGDYSIDVSLGAAERAGQAAVALVDPVVRKGLAFDGDRIVAVEGAESSKTLAGCEAVLVAMNKVGLKRGDTVAAVGGGVIQDVATLTTSLYMRGVDWVYVPTTLMAMVDSCIGGKSSINAGGIKNLVGNFHPPVKVLVDPHFIPSLPRLAIVSGLAEAVKICFVRGRESFTTFLASSASLEPGADEATVALIQHVLESKKWFVEIDEFDKAERQLLNFGHSFGHAWEAACGFRVQHGIGVAVGMLAALRHPLSFSTDVTRGLDAYAMELLRSVADDVTAALDATDWSIFRSALAADKKNGHETLRLVLPAEESVRIFELPLDDEQLTIAQDALSTALQEVVA